MTIEQQLNKLRKQYKKTTDPVIRELLHRVANSLKEKAELRKNVVENVL